MDLIDRKQPAPMNHIFRFYEFKDYLRAAAESGCVCISWALTLPHADRLSARTPIQSNPAVFFMFFFFFIMNLLFLCFFTCLV